jgi:type II secretory pathway component GspD/PulD (secretin)
MNCRLWRWSLSILIQASVSLPASASVGEPPTDSKLKPESAAQTISKALDQPISVEFANAALQDAVTKLTDQTKLNFVLDRASMQQLGIVPEQSLVTVKLEKAPLRVGLRRLLSQYNLGYAVVGDMVLITTEDMAIHRQMRQRINLDLDRLPLDAALRDLAKRTVTNLVLDGRVIKEAQTPVTLKLEDVPLEVAVRLMANQAGLRPVRTGNVLYVTTKANAAELKGDSETPAIPGAVPSLIDRLNQ